ncbi:MAG: hypothetical protein MI757_01315 [Pirellulales bacterium]|nr:hypothetical protein [Pirellulales bacterium]
MREQQKGRITHRTAAWLFLVLAVGVGCSQDAPSDVERDADVVPKPIRSGVATGTDAGDAGYDRLELPNLPDLAAVKSAAPPRSRDEIFAEQMQLPRLYLTGQSLKRLIAPTGQRNLVDEETGEICWPALACYKPDCPGRSKNGESFVFIVPDPNAYVSASGRVAYRPRPNDPLAASNESSSNLPFSNFAKNQALLGHICPACLKVRDLANETDEDRRQYRRWIRPHELPETTQRIRELNEERRRRIVWERSKS